MEKLNYETIKTYQSFTSIHEMDQSVRGFLYKFKSSLSDGTVKVLHFIWKYSVKVVGVSFAKYDTIAERGWLEQKDGHSCSEDVRGSLFYQKNPNRSNEWKAGCQLYM